MAPDLPKPPRYQEAYPLLDIRKAVSAMADGRTLCVWSRMEGHLAGHGLIKLERNRLRLSFWFMGPTYVQPRRASSEFMVESVKAGTANERLHVICPGCSKRRLVLAYCGSWKCRVCHGFVYRSQAVEQDVRLSENLDAVRGVIRYGRPAGMHQRTYDKLLFKKYNIEERLGSRYLTATALYKLDITCSFIRPDEDRIAASSFAAES